LACLSGRSFRAASCLNSACCSDPPPGPCQGDLGRCGPCGYDGERCRCWSGAWGKRARPGVAGRFLVYDKLRERDPEYWGKKYRETDLYREYVSQGASEEKKSGRAQVVSRPVRSEPHSPARQLATLVARQFVSRLKDWKNVAGMLVPTLAIALLTGLVSAGPNGPETVLMVVFAGMWCGCSASVREIVESV